MTRLARASKVGFTCIAAIPSSREVPADVPRIDSARNRRLRLVATRAECSAASLVRSASVRLSSRNRRTSSPSRSYPVGLARSHCSIASSRPPCSRYDSSRSGPSPRRLRSQSFASRSSSDRAPRARRCSSISLASSGHRRSRASCATSTVGLPSGVVWVVNRRASTNAFATMSSSAVKSARSMRRRVGSPEGSRLASFSNVGMTCRPTPSRAHSAARRSASRCTAPTTPPSCS